MRSTPPLRILVDAEQAHQDLALLAGSAQLSQGVAQRLVSLFPEALNLDAHLACVNLDTPATARAGELRVRLQLANGLAQLVAAIRAGEFNDLPR